MTSFMVESTNLMGPPWNEESGQKRVTIEVEPITLSLGDVTTEHQFDCPWLRVRLSIEGSPQPFVVEGPPGDVGELFEAITRLLGHSDTVPRLGRSWEFV